MTKNQFWKGSTFFVLFSFDLTLLVIEQPVQCTPWLQQHPVSHFFGDTLYFGFKVTFFWDTLYFGFNSHLPYVAAVPRPSGHHLDVDREDGVGSEIWTPFLRSTK